VIITERLNGIKGWLTHTDETDHRFGYISVTDLGQG